MLSKRIEWLQAPRHPMSKQRDPIQGEFFNTDTITTLAAKLTREGIGQNPLDAADPSAKSPVHVRVFISGASGALPCDVANAYFSGLREHVAACDPDAATQFDEPCRFLVVEDFGTTGLRGDPTSVEEPPGGTPNDFFYFFRAEGKSGKSGADRGRWGVGKYVFPMASHINTFFALTIRNEDPAGPLLMGQAVLKNHRIGDISYEPDGWWADRDERGVPVPIADIDTISGFRAAWNVTRDHETGLSVVIPYVHEELRPWDVVRAIAEDYYLAVLTNRFTAEVASPDLDADILIDPTTLDHIVQRSAGDPQNLMKQIELVRWHLGLTAADLVSVARPGERSPRWSPELLDGPARARIRHALGAGTPVAVRVPVEVQRKSESTSKWSYFDVLLAAEPGLTRRPQFVREGLIIPDVSSPPLSGIRCIVTIEDATLARMVGDAEGPAHANWSPQTQKFSGNYAYGKQWLSFIKRAPAELLRIVRGEDEEADPVLLARFFPLPSTVKTPPGPEAPAPRPGPGPTPSGPQIQGGKPRLLRVSRVDRGFSVHLTDHGRSRVARVRLRVAYDSRRGNPFARWSPEDFDFAGSEITVDVRGGTIAKRKDNRLLVAVDDPDGFTLHARGFDPKRDLRIHAEAERPE